MYYLSKLTGNYYNSEFVEVPKDDSKQVYLDMIESGQIETVESLGFEIEAMNAPKVPSQLSRMKFIIQVFITTGIKYEDIVLFIQNLTFDEAQKYVILTRLRSATHFDRNSNDLLTIAAMMGITSEQLDNIFINGNMIE